MRKSGSGLRGAYEGLAKRCMLKAEKSGCRAPPKHGRAKMHAISAVVVVGAFFLFFVVSRSVLSAFSKMPGHNGRTEEPRQLREGSWLIGLDFLLILLILVWRVL
jgi:hypothetical protein